MNILINSEIHIKEPTKEIIDYCKNNLVIPNPDYAKKKRMGFWVGTTPPVLHLYTQVGDELVLPFGCLRSILPFLRGSQIVKDFPPVYDINYGTAISLYDYQQEAVNNLISSQYGILQSKAGSGKTQMGIALIMAFGMRALWLTHTTDLLNQSKARALKYIDSSLIGTITGGKVEIGKGVTFATVQTMSKLDLPKLKYEWDVIVVDECHRVAGTPTALTMFAKVLNNLSARHKYGLSATVHRADGMIKATYAQLGEVVYVVPDEAIADKVMKVGIYPVDTDLQLDYDCLNSDGTINYAKLITYLTESEERNKLIVDCIVDQSSHPSLILSDRLNHLEALMSMMPSSLAKYSAMVSGKMNTKKGKEERERILEDMRSGKLKYLFATYSLAKEGLDVPCLERLYLTTPQKDYAVVTQSIGRIARTSEGKLEPIAYDFVDDIDYLVKAYKKRKGIYKQNDCYFIE